MKYESKDALLADIRTEHAKLLDLVDRVHSDRREEPGVWGDDWTVKDLLAHLSAWHELFLRWYSDGQAGRTPDMPAPGYRWNETPALNRAIQERHADGLWADVRAAFDRTHGRVVELVKSLSEAELMEPGHFEWTGKNPLTTYLGANTASHYRFASKVLKRWQRQSP